MCTFTTWPVCTSTTSLTRTRLTTRPSGITCQPGTRSRSGTTCHPGTRSRSGITCQPGTRSRWGITCQPGTRSRSGTTRPAMDRLARSPRAPQLRARRLRAPPLRAASEREPQTRPRPVRPRRTRHRPATGARRQHRPPEGIHHCLQRTQDGSPQPVHGKGQVSRPRGVGTTWQLPIPVVLPSVAKPPRIPELETGFERGDEPTLLVRRHARTLGPRPSRITRPSGQLGPDTLLIDAGDADGDGGASRIRPEPTRPHGLSAVHVEPTEGLPHTLVCQPRGDERRDRCRPPAGGDVQRGRRRHRPRGARGSRPGPLARVVPVLHRVDERSAAVIPGPLHEPKRPARAARIDEGVAERDPERRQQGDGE